MWSWGGRGREGQPVSLILFSFSGLSSAVTTLSSQRGLGLVFTSKTTSFGPAWAPQMGPRPGQGKRRSRQAIWSWTSIMGPQRIPAHLSEWEGSGVPWGSAGFVSF